MELQSWVSRKYDDDVDLWVWMEAGGDETEKKRRRAERGKALIEFKLFS